MARRGERPPIGLTWIVTWPLSAVFAALAFLAAQEIHHPSREPAAPPPAAAAIPGGPGWTETFPSRVAAVDAALHQARLRLPKPVAEERGSGPLRWTHRLYEMDLPRADQGKAEAAIEALRGADPGLAVTAENTADGTDVKVGLDGLLISTLRFRWGDRVTPKPVHPRLAVVVAALGDDLRVARRVVDLDGPVALAVRPFRPFSTQVAELGRMFDRQVLVQLDGAGDASAAGAEQGAVADLNAALASVPQAVGVAWVPANGGPPDAQLVAAVSQRQLVFVGGAPAQAGAAAPVLAAFGEGGPEAISGELGAVLEKARSEGGAIAIGEPTEASVTALANALSGWRSADVELVPVTALVPPTALSAR